MTFGGGGFGTLNLLKVKVRPLIDFTMLFCKMIIPLLCRAIRQSTGGEYAVIVGIVRR